MFGFVFSAFSKVVENTAMFGDLVLRLPDVVHGLFDKNTEWNSLIGWCVWFSVESKVFDGGSEKLLNLVRNLFTFFVIGKPTIF